METSAQLQCDVLVVGGGINGVGIARDAAGRGLSVVLCEKDDLAAHTSSASSKLIHGGLRYLEHYEFGLVRKALIEREVLLRAAPHIMWPMRFVMPQDKGQRPAWMIRAGMFLYDHLARRELLPGSETINLHRHPAGEPLKPEFHRGYVYSDGWVDDARLVVLNAVDAAEKGARIYTRTVCESIRRNGESWDAVMRDRHGKLTSVQARCVVNATGPWVTKFLQGAAQQSSDRAVRLIKGSHIVVPRLFDHPYAYILQNPDGRIVFAIPYQQDFTLVGTTDLEYHGDTEKVAIDQEEIEYLCALTERYFRRPVRPSDVVWSYSGVRPLVEDESSNASAVTRDYRLEMENHGAPLLSVFGGKITTFRKLAEEAVDMVAARLGNRRGPWTEVACLPGGDIYGQRPENRAVLEFDGFIHQKQQQYAWLDTKLVARLTRAYGSRIDAVLQGKANVRDLGEEVIPGLYACELDYLMQHEWAVCADDVLWRRSKLGLRVPPSAKGILDSWMEKRQRT